MQTTDSVISRWFPEFPAGGFCSLDGTIEFYTRINALLKPGMNVLDFGAGRGAAFAEGRSDYKKKLMSMRAEDVHVTACDVDTAVLEHPHVDRTVVLELGAALPFEDDSFDLIASDYVFEHIADPAQVSSELLRILKPGGWLCARTPNKYCPVSLATRLISNSRHHRILKKAQPDRKQMDVFPTEFKLNNMRSIARWFPPSTFENFTYRYEAEPSYFFNSRIVFSLILLMNRLLPPVMKSNLFVFLRKHEHT